MNAFRLPAVTFNKNFAFQKLRLNDMKLISFGAWDFKALIKYSEIIDKPFSRHNAMTGTI